MRNGRRRQKGERDSTGRRRWTLQISDAIGAIASASTSTSTTAATTPRAYFLLRPNEHTYTQQMHTHTWLRRTLPKHNDRCVVPCIVVCVLLALHTQCVAIEPPYIRSATTYAMPHSHTCKLTHAVHTFYTGAVYRTPPKWMDPCAFSLRNSIPRSSPPPSPPVCAHTIRFLTKSWITFSCLHAQRIWPRRTAFNELWLGQLCCSLFA